MKWILILIALAVLIGTAGAISPAAINFSQSIDSDINIGGHNFVAGSLNGTALSAVLDRSLLLNKSGGTMTGPLAMGGYSLTGATNVNATSFFGSGAGLTGITGATGGVANTGSTTIGADTDSNGVGVVSLQTRGADRLVVENDGDITVGGSIDAPDISNNAAAHSAINASRIYSFISSSINYTAAMATGDYKKIIIINATSADRYVTMPDPTTCSGKEVWVKKNSTDVSANYVYVEPYGSEKFLDDDSYDNMTISSPGGILIFISDSVNWQVVGGR